MKSKHCQWCDHQFDTSISYQIYCSAECREQATKDKIAARYVQTKALRRVGKKRLCLGCKAQLSVFNDDTLCSSCLINPKDVKNAIKDIKGLMNEKDSTD